MREVAQRKTRRKRKNGCGCGFVVFLLFVIILFVVARLVVNWYFNSDVVERMQKNQYPIKYEHFVDKYSAKYGLDRYLVFAVIRTESKFDKTAVSPVGAKGLMQITNETGSDYAKKIGLSGYKEEKLFDPETNIQLGCYYLNVLLKKYNGDITASLAAYNGGPGNVDQWLSSNQYTDENGKLKNIPYNETKNYVSRVLESQKMYKSIYESDNE